MLDFPSTPSVGDTLTGPSGQEWEWDGVKWISVSVVGGGGGGGWPAMGITDGNDAAPGEVGEVVIKQDWDIEVSNDSFNGYGFLGGTYWWILPAGDWDIEGYLTFDSWTAIAGNIWFNDISIWVNGYSVLFSDFNNTQPQINMYGQSFNNHDQATFDLGINGAIGYLIIPKFRANGADNSPMSPAGGGIGIDVSISSPLGGFSVGINMRARRMR